MGKGKGIEDKGKGVDQKHHRCEGVSHGLVHQQQRYHRHNGKLHGPKHHQHRCEGKSHGNMRQEQGNQTGSNLVFHDFSSIFSSTPIVQPAWDHDLR